MASCLQKYRASDNVRTAHNFADRRDPCELVAPEPTLADVMAELRALRSEVAALRPPPRRPLAPRDHEWLIALLPAIDAATGDAIRTTAELSGLALRHDNDSLTAALSRYALSMRGLGKALARVAGHPVAGYELRHVGHASGASLWQCVRV